MIPPVEEQIAALVNKSIRNRQLAVVAIWITIAQVLIGLLLVFVGVVAIRGNATADEARAAAGAAQATATANAAANHATCVAGNESRRDGLRLWESLIASAPTMNPAAVDLIRKNAESTYLPLRDCDAVAPIPPPASG